MTAWQAPSSAPALRIVWLPKAAASRSSLIVRATLSRSLSSDRSATCATLNFTSLGLVLSAALVDAISTSVPSSPTLEFSCL